MWSKIKKEIIELIKKNFPDIEIVEADFVFPPEEKMGDLSLPCFNLAKIFKTPPAEIAKELSQKLEARGVLSKIEAAGPYLNFFLDEKKLASLVLKEILKDKGKYGQNTFGKGKKVMVEFAHPNTHKMFHIGHLRNIVTGESIARILGNAGYKVIRANYQGDVGPHIAKCLYGIEKGGMDEKKLKTLDEKMKFLGQAYALGHQAYEESEDEKKKIEELNQKIYTRDKSILSLYRKTRGWSLQYFNKIYKRVYSRFDRLYFESEVFGRGKELVNEFLEKGVFKESEGAIIFEGKKYGLHDRVFLNSRGLPTYEAKDLGLAELQFKEFKPEKVFHVVAREQSDYFKVLFRALEFVFPQSRDREEHLVYGWVSLKDGKMSSRTGNVIAGEWLLDEVKNKIGEVMASHKIVNKEKIKEQVAVAAVKYAFLRSGVDKDIAFDIKESVSLAGDSGTYLLYIVARINSIFKNNKNKKGKIETLRSIEIAEKNLILRLSNFPAATNEAAQSCDPSKISHYLFELAKEFNNFYNQCPVLNAPKAEKNFRLCILESVKTVMVSGLKLLGIEAPEEM